MHIIYSNFLESIQNHKNKDLLIEILHKRLDGIIPKKIYSTESYNYYDYEDGLDENLKKYIKDFDIHYYPKKLLSYETTKEVTVHLIELNKLYNLFDNINISKYNTIDDVLTVISDIFEKKSNLFENIIKIILDSKKDIFIIYLKEEFNMIFNIDIEYNIIVNWYNESKSFDLFFSNIQTYLREIIIPGYPNFDSTNTYMHINIYQNLSKIDKTIYMIKWVSYSYEMKFFDKLKSFDNKFNKKLEYISLKIENQFMLYESININNNTKLIPNNTIINYFETIDIIKNELYKILNIKIKLLNNNSLLENIFKDELNNILIKNNITNTLIIKYLENSLNEYKLCTLLDKTIDCTI
jgi:hypothetical protein